MVVCMITEGRTFVECWLLITGLGWIFTMGLSSITFYFLYSKPTYKLWRYKSNPEYPSTQKVSEEIIQMNKGLLMAAIPPAMALWLAHRGYSHGYCYRVKNIYIEILSQLAYFIFLDFAEFFYHYNTHVRKFLWRFHKFHHTFPNPSPFAVIADEVIDQLVRAAPMVIYPIFLPLNIDIMFFQMAIIIYGYGTYLHSGHEFDYPDAHHPILNTAFQHYCHHSISIINAPYHCGFVLKFFDNLWGSVYKGKCFCAKCARENGERSIEKWDKTEIPDYSILLNLNFWKQKIADEISKIKNGTLLKIV